MTSGRIYQGTPVSSGIAIGSAYTLDRRRLHVPRFRVPPEGRPPEVERFRRAVELSQEQMEQLEVTAASTGLSQVSTLLRAHRMILEDAAFFDATIHRIQDEGQNAEWAVRTILREVRRLFEQVEQDYFRERRNDVDLVGDRVLRNLVGSSPDPWSDLPEDAIVVASDLSPADTVVLANKRVRAFATETGGRTSHTAIVARALRVPCVLGVSHLMDDIATADTIIVDGRVGTVVVRPDNDEIDRYRGLERRRRKEREALLADRDLPAQTVDGERLTLLANIEAYREVEWVRQHGGEGIGLYRTEFLYIDESRIDEVESQVRAYRRVIEGMEGRPVTIRTFDWGGDKEHPGGATRTGIRAGYNPALGLRALRWSFRDRGLFRIQLQAILRASAFGPTQIMFPFVTEPLEMDGARDEVEQVKAELAAKGVAFDPEIRVGTMLETPASVFCIDQLAARSDFFAVGTNDLIQLVMAADRTNDEVAYLHRPCHPVVLRVLDRIRRESVRTVSICGEVAADPFLTPLLVGLGYRSLSMAAAAIPVVKRMVRRLRASDCEQLVEEALSCVTAVEVERLVAERLAEWVPELVGRKSHGMEPLLTEATTTSDDVEPPATTTMDVDVGTHSS